MSTPIADMITEMLKNCIPMETIIMAVRSMEIALSTRHRVDSRVDEIGEKRRAWDREYRRRRREHPPDIHPTPPDSTRHPPDYALSSISLEEGSKEDSRKKERKSRGCKIPPDWKPNERHYTEGAKRGMSREEVDCRATKLRNWCEANANRSITTKSNWDAAFMPWLEDKYGNKPIPAKNTYYDPKNGYGDDHW